MHTHVAFLGGINVGGKMIVPMKRLAAVAASLELDQVKTHLQSGNLLFTVPADRIDAIGSRLEAEIEMEFGFRPAVIIRSRDEIRRVVSSNPFASPGVNRSRLVTVFLRSAPSRSGVGNLEPERFPDVSFVVSGKEMQVLYGGGLGSSKFVPAYFERRLGTIGTARNWNTVTKINSLLDSDARGTTLLA